MKNLSLYEKAHIFTSAIRILEYKKNGLPPSATEISELLDISVEETLLISRKLEDATIIAIIEKNNTSNFIIKHHNLIESLPKENNQLKLDNEINEFKEKQKNKSKEIEEFQKKQKEKQQQLFDKLNKELEKSRG